MSGRPHGTPTPLFPLPANLHACQSRLGAMRCFICPAADDVAGSAGVCCTVTAFVNKPRGHKGIHVAQERKGLVRLVTKVNCSRLRNSKIALCYILVFGV